MKVFKKEFLPFFFFILFVVQWLCVLIQDEDCASMTMLNFLKGKLQHIPEATLKINMEIKVRTRQFAL